MGSNPFQYDGHFEAVGAVQEWIARAAPNTVVIITATDCLLASIELQHGPPSECDLVSVEERARAMALRNFVKDLTLQT